MLKSNIYNYIYLVKWDEYFLSQVELLDVLYFWLQAVLLGFLLVMASYYG